MDALEPLYEKCMRAYSEAFYPWDPFSFRRTFKEDEVEVLEYKGRIVGLLKTMVYEDHLYLAEIQLDTVVRNRGLGTLLVRRTLDRGASLGLPVLLRVLRNNPARGLYERLGFRVIRENTFDYVLQNP